jgi:hypothetical protein
MMHISQLWTYLSDRGKVHPRIGHEGPNEEYGYSSTLNLNSVLDEDGWLTPHLSPFTQKFGFRKGQSTKPLIIFSENLTCP